MRAVLVRDLANFLRVLRKFVDERHALGIDVISAQIEEAGEYDLEGLFIRLGYAIDSIGAKRVAIDTIEALFGGLQNPAILRAD